MTKPDLKVAAFGGGFFETHSLAASVSTSPLLEATLIDATSAVLSPLLPIRKIW